MSIKQNIRDTLSNIKKEYGKIEFSDKILDLISITGFALFIVSLLTVFLSGKFNVVNIVFILYPMIVSGLAASTRMRKREDPTSVEKLFKDWVWIMGTISVIALIVIIIGLIIA
jgi:magnesium-transporting ATPase (P-type)